MKHIYSFLLIILFLSFSCNKSKTTQEVSKNIDSLKISLDTRIVSRLGETLIPTAKKAVSDWKEYRNVDKFILKYYNISTMEALQNARELSELVKQMKDSIRVEKLKQPSVIARLNVLENESLRLADMATIHSISNEEVKNEVEKIVEIYSAVNSKINTIYKVAAIQKSLEVDTEIPIEIKKKPAKRPKRYRNKIIPPKKTKQ
ncbi:hypothetical protein [Lutibacter sp.]|uniref:hypothetical protein n=1 Tax=Lutibacter sp. TaxID=1925666 RepID=UPI0025B9A454|nr:hypothetical protein [Lutibacter sp.]MCF6168445.1 hypothetical protein [Lutibacter sp.]